MPIIEVLYSMVPIINSDSNPCCNNNNDNNNVEIDYVINSAIPVGLCYLIVDVSFSAHT